MYNCKVISPSRAALTSVVTVATLLIAAHFAAPGYAAFKRCSDGSTPRVRCSKVKVPLDYSGATKGTIALNVKRIKSKLGSGGAPIVALAGGPGQAAADLITTFQEELKPVLKGRDLIAFDQRGTGYSSFLRCKAIEDPKLTEAGLPDAAAKCANQIGPKRAFFMTRDSADDIEGIRKELGVDKISLAGVSYGTKVALVYALRYPSHVDRLVLDSVVTQDGPAQPPLSSYRSVGAILERMCSNGGCKGITKDPAADLNKLLVSTDSTGINGRYIRPDGRPRQATFGYGIIEEILFQGDFLPFIRVEFPAAVNAAVSGDTAPLVRIFYKFRSGFYLPGMSQSPVDRSFSVPLFFTTICEEANFPWEPGSAFEQRRQSYLNTVNAFAATELYPLTHKSARNNLEYRLCSKWPNAGKRPDYSGPLPDVPALILEGEFDLRTPVEDGVQVASAFPKGQFVEVPYTGHSVLSSDATADILAGDGGCAQKALKGFFAGREVGSVCKGSKTNKFLRFFFSPIPVPPKSLKSVKPIAGIAGKRGRTAAAVVITMDRLATSYILNAFSQIFTVISGMEEDFTIRDGGLRSGRYFERNGDLVFRRYSSIGGVKITGGVHGEVTRLRVHGKSASRGNLVVRNQIATGKLGGRRVRFRIDASLLFTIIGDLGALNAEYRPEGAGPAGFDLAEINDMSRKARQRIERIRSGGGG